jgi:hypothetical protein
MLEKGGCPRLKADRAIRNVQQSLKATKVKCEGRFVVIRDKEMKQYSMKTYGELEV